MAATYKYKGYILSRTYFEFINNPPLLLWTARQGRANIPPVKFKTARLQDLKEHIKKILTA